MGSWPIGVDEITERYRPMSLWPFSTAMTVSLVIHGMAIALLLMWIDQDKLANSTMPARVFDIALSRATSTQNSGVNENFIADTPAAIADQIARLDAPQPQEVAPTIEQAASQKPISPSTQPQKENKAVPALESLALTPADLTAQVDQHMAVVTPSTSHWQLALAAPETPQPEPQLQALSPSEQEMLEEQLQDWQDNFELLEHPDQPITWQQGKQVFQASVKQQNPQNNTDLERAIVEISTEVDGVMLSTQMAFKRLAFSNYAQLVDRWDRDVAVSEDEIYGRFHSNSRIVVSPQRRSEPVFAGKVTVASSISMRGLTRKADVFLGGLETRVTPIALPKQLHSHFTSEDLSDNPNTEYFFDRDGQVTFQETGGFQWQDETETTWYDCWPQCFIVAGEDVRLSVEGVVKGTAVITALDTIRITGDLTYQQHPLEVADSQDFLGMLSENYIEIAPPDITGQGDLTVHGALYAKRRFVVRNFRSRNKGTLNLFGSLTAGSLSATEPRYATRIDFDPRFEEQRPPNFPMTNKFELDNWDKQWTIQPN